MTRPASFLITWPGRCGPVVRRFSEAAHLEAYVKSWKAVAGPQSCTWLTPFVVQAHA